MGSWYTLGRKFTFRSSGILFHYIIAIRVKVVLNGILLVTLVQSKRCSAKHTCNGGIMLFYSAQRYINDGVPELTNDFKSILKRFTVPKPELPRWE